MRFFFPALLLSIALTLTSGCSTAAHTEQEKPESASNDKRVEDLSQVVNQLKARVEELTVTTTLLQAKLDDAKAKSEPAKQNTEKLTSHSTNKIKTVPIYSTHEKPNVSYSKEGATLKFQKALSLMKNNQYNDANLAFSDFLKENPDHALASEAQYYIGECYYQEKEYKLAEQEFERVVLIYPRASHFSDSLLRLVQLSEKSTPKKNAESHRQLLITQFPQSPATRALLDEEKSDDPKIKPATPPKTETPATAPVSDNSSAKENE